MKKVLCIAAVLALLSAMTGCACTANSTLSPSPSVEPTAAMTPMLEVTPDMGGTSPDMSASPDGAAAGEAGASASPNGADGAGAAGTGGGTIANFQEGTEVQAADVPEIQKAIEAKYENAQIKSIRHAKNGEEQVYEVEITSGSATQTVYVRPDGTVIEKNS